MILWKCDTFVKAFSFNRVCLTKNLRFMSSFNRKLSLFVLVKYFHQHTWQTLLSHPPDMCKWLLRCWYQSCTPFSHFPLVVLDIMISFIVTTLGHGADNCWIAILRIYNTVVNLVFIGYTTIKLTSEREGWTI